MVFIYFILFIMFTGSSATQQNITEVQQNETYEKVHVSIDSYSNMDAEELLFAITAVQHGILKGGSDRDIVEHIFEILNVDYPNVNRSKVWTVIQGPTAHWFWRVADVTLSACQNCICKDYVLFYVSWSAC